MTAVFAGEGEGVVFLAAGVLEAVAATDFSLEFTFSFEVDLDFPAFACTASDFAVSLLFIGISTYSSCLQPPRRGSPRREPHKLH